MANIFTEALKASKITLIQDGEKTIIAADVIKSEEHKFAAEATRHEIEDGSEISDHIINRGKTLRLEGEISDDPITILQTGILERTITGVIPQTIKSKLNFGLGGDKAKPSKEAFDQFEKIYDEKRPVVIITGLKKYEDMVMEDVSFPRTSETVASLRFIAFFRQINIVTTEYVTAPNAKQEATLGAESKKNIGKNNGKLVIEDKNETLAISLKDWLVGLFK